MALLSGEYKCSCGYSFEWSALTFEQGEVSVFWVDRANKNAKLIEHSRNRDIVEVLCPRCKAKNTIIQER